MIINTEKALLLFSVGPVQSFIAASRKTLDLFSGSEFLSRITGAAIRGILDESTIIFPFVEKESDLEQPLPNRFFALVNFENAKNIAAKAELSARDYINKKLAHARRSVQGTEVDLEMHPWVEQWNEQANAYWEFYYTYMAVDPGQLENQQYYGKMYAAIEKLSGERKALRDFKQLTQYGIKCNYFQGFSALFPLGHNNLYGNAKEFTGKHLVKLKPAGRYKKTEALSAIGFLKREFGKEQQQGSAFPSTISFANGDFNKAVVELYSERAEMMTLVNSFNRQFRKFADFINFYPERTTEEDINTKGSNYPLLESKSNDRKLSTYLQLDNQFLLPEELEISRIRSEFGLEDDVEIGTLVKDLRKVAGELTDFVKKNSDTEVKKYYAVLYFDGDNMGKWLSGSIKRDINGVEESFPISLQTHKNISASLKRFSMQTVRQIVEKEHLGKLVYAGGDDVIAFCTLSHLIPIITKIRSAFEECMKGATGGFAPATGSVGIAIAHWQHALQSVMTEARNAERYAKHTLERNAFGISVLKRSGERYTTGAKFDTDTNFLAMMEEFIDLLNCDKLSTSFVYELEMELNKIHPPKNEDVELGLLMLTFKYFISRKSETKTGAVNKTAQTTITDISDRIEGLLKKSKNKYECMLSIVGLMKTAQFMRRGND